LEMVFENLKESIAKFFRSEKYEEAVNEFIKDLQKELVKSLLKPQCLCLGGTPQLS